MGGGEALRPSVRPAYHLPDTAAGIVSSCKRRAGPFSLEPINRDTDKYGRALRIVTRDGESVGAALVDEGLAERWKGYRGGWC